HVRPGFRAGTDVAVRSEGGPGHGDTDDPGRADVHLVGRATTPDDRHDLHRIVDRDRVAGAVGHARLVVDGGGRVDADHLTGLVDQRASGVAGTDVGQDLDQTLELLGAPGQ